MPRGLKWTGVIVAAMGIIMVLTIWLIWIPNPQEPPYRFIKAWGEPGNQPGQFQDPTGVAVTGKEVFVSDARNHRIQVFDHDGRFLRIIGGPDTLGRPLNLTYTAMNFMSPITGTIRLSCFP